MTDVPADRVRSGVSSRRMTAYVGAQFPVRAAGWPLPNTFGALGACAVIVVVSRPVQARLAASLQP